jgi:hypothetical protein
MVHIHDRFLGRVRGATPSVSGADLHLDLSGPGLRTGLMEALREAVRSGRLVRGTQLPSSRALATDLGMARNRGRVLCRVGRGGLARRPTAIRYAGVEAGGPVSGCAS